MHSTTCVKDLGRGDEKAEKVSIILSWHSSQILEIRRVPMPEPVLPPRECQMYT